MGDMNGDDAEIDERQGVAVAFDEDEDESAIVNEVRDESSEDEEGDEDEDGGLAGAEAEQNMADEMVLDNGPSDNKRKNGEKGSIPAREIDAFWLQRQIGILYPDAHEQADKTKDALRVLSGEPDEDGGDEKSLREIENDLMELFDFEHHELVQKLVENREKVFWLTEAGTGRIIRRSSQC